MTEAPPGLASARRHATREDGRGDRCTACLLVVAKAPVPGLAKTRLASTVGDRAAARMAAAALLDTLAAVRAVPDTIPVVALTGDLSAAERSGELTAALAGCTVVPQTGDDLGERLANAHVLVGERFPGVPVFQIGMDTPQLRPELLIGAVARLLADDTDAVLGPATDGGWWGLGLRRPADAVALRTVPMSRPDTGNRTLRALRHRRLRVERLLVLSDVDTMLDAAEVAASAPSTRFARAFAEVAVASELASEPSDTGPPRAAGPSPRGAVGRELAGEPMSQGNRERRHRACEGES